MTVASGFTETGYTHRVFFFSFSFPIPRFMFRNLPMCGWRERVRGQPTLYFFRLEFHNE